MNQRQITRRLAMALGLGTFASISVPPLLRLANLSQQADATEGGTPPDFTVVGNASLRERAAAKRLLFGAATGYSKLTSDAAFNTQVAEDCAILMADEDLLWGALHPDVETFAFAKGDWLIDYARKNKMLVGATHLVWHEYMPQWLQEKLNKQNAEQILNQHINKVVTRYAKKIHFWSVVNEAILTSDKRPDGLRKTPWLEFLGADYIEMAFRAAAAADPQALLLYNDNALEYDIPYHDERRAAVLKWLEKLKSKGTPIHGLGLQSHIGKLENFSAKKLKTFLRDVASLGLKIIITEMDVGDAGMPTDINQRDRMVAEVYKQFLSVVLEEPAVSGVITWGLSDKYTWLSDYSPRADGTPVRPLPYDANMNRKLAWNAIARAFDNTNKRRYSSKLWSAWKKLQAQA